MPGDSIYPVLIVRLAAGVGGLLAANGVVFFVAPAAGLRLFGLPNVAPDLLPPLLGIREVAFGLAVLVLVYRGHTRALAAFLLLGALVPVVDAVVVIHTSGTVAALPHLAAVPTCVGVGVLLWRNDRGLG